MHAWLEGVDCERVAMRRSEGVFVDDPGMECCRVPLAAFRSSIHDNPYVVWFILRPTSPLGTGGPFLVLTKMMGDVEFDDYHAALAYAELTTGGA